MSDLERLLEVQELDSEIDGIAQQSDRLPERIALAEATAALRAAQGARDAAAQAIALAEARIAELESAGEQRARRSALLGEQLRQASSERQAAALTHELDALTAERSVADDEELALLEEVEEASARRDEVLGSLDALIAQEAGAAQELRAAEGTLDGRRAELGQRRASAAERVPASLLERYEQMRAAFGGVAVARMSGGRCGACHLDQSRTMIEALRRAGPEEMFECEQCGRLLVQG